MRDSVHCPIVQASEELEVLILDTGGLTVNPELVLELAHRRVDDAGDLTLLNLGLLIHLRRCHAVEGMTATGVSPNGGERYLIGGALLEKQLPGSLVEHEHGESPVQEPPWCFRREDV